ncbi:hypothetical protein [Fusobacterium necrophorum]|jgi:hypothetical protein|uniref:hypothetical protein n=1 Tax=Fusobacterium necrophorum TaxID=859 RepID=UPI00241D83DD|nr:hypothetical protein [Fusobacterium necrophorum]MDK4523188.1 hypothetical protein [Fusobacterium necrophorum]
MAIKTSGPLKFSEIREELGLSGQIRLGQTEVRGLASVSSGKIKFSDFYGKSNFNGVYLSNGILKNEEEFYPHEEFYLSNSVNFKTFLNLSKSGFHYDKYQYGKQFLLHMVAKGNHQFPDQLMLYLKNKKIGVKKKKLIKQSGSGDGATYFFENAKNIQNFKNYFMNYRFMQGQGDSPIFFHIQTVDLPPVKNDSDGELVRNAIAKRVYQYGYNITTYDFETSSSDVYETEMDDNLLEVKCRYYGTFSLQIVSKKQIHSKHLYFSIRRKNNNQYFKTFKSDGKEEQKSDNVWVYEYRFSRDSIFYDLFDISKVGFEEFIYSILTSDLYEMDNYLY